MNQKQNQKQSRKEYQNTGQRITALYERLSREDEAEGESNSIGNQKAYLTEYAERNGFKNCRHYTDDGFSGKDFNRPGWKRLINDIEEGLVETVIAKDLSRVGRNYIQTGFYTEIFFREKNVRFIAIGNSVDTVNPQSAEFTPIMNVMNDLYLHDQSRKMRTFYQQKGKKGLPTNNLCVYGYRKDPEDKNHWLVDAEAAAVVRRIFQLAIDCHGPYEIARILAEEKVFCPAYYNSLHETCMKRANTDMTKPYAWNGVTVGNILRRPEYMGHTVNFRSSKNGLRAKRYKKPEEEWLVFENTHEAIIPPDEWELAQYVLFVRRRTDSTGKANPLTGKLFCAECGAALNNHRSKAKETGRASDDYYDCPTYSQGKGDCSCHYVTTEFIRTAILESIRSVTQFAVTDEEAFAEQVRSLSTLRHANAVKEKAEEIEKAKKRIAELDIIIQKLYESYALNKIPENRYESLSASYEKEQAELRVSLKRDEAMLNNYDHDSENIGRFLVLAQQFRETDDLSPAVINSLIDKVIVHAPEKIHGQRCVQIEIVFQFIGSFTVPQAEQILTKEEREREQQEEMRREKEREKNHQRYLRRKERRNKEQLSEKATA